MNNEFFKSDEAIRDDILERLHKKYGVEFVAISLVRGYEYSLYCYPKGGDPEADLVKAIIREDKGKEREYLDTYFGIIIREEFEADILSVLSDIDVPKAVFLDSQREYYKEQFDGTKNYSDYKEWLREGNPWRPRVTVVLGLDNVDEAESYANQIFGKASDGGVRGFITVRVFPPEGLSRATRVNLDELTREYDPRRPDKGEYGPSKIVFSESI